MGAVVVRLSTIAEGCSRSCASACAPACVSSCPSACCPSLCSEMAKLWPDVLRDEVAVAEPSRARGRKKEDLSSRGESGEKEGNEVSDLSEGAMEDAELEGWESSFLRARALERWLRVETPDCCEMERSRGAEYEALVTSMASDQLSHVAHVGHVGHVGRVHLDRPVIPCHLVSTSFFSLFFLPRCCER